MEIVKYQIKVYDNIIEIIPDDGVKDNSIYEIKLNNLQEYQGKRILPKTKLEFATALKPAYTTLLSVQSLIAGTGVPDKDVLYHIREASKLADFKKGVIKIDQTNIPYEVEQFVRYQASHDSLLRFYIEKASSTGSKGQLGDVMFDNTGKMSDITGLLKELAETAKYWSEVMRGYKDEGRVAPKSTVRGSKAINPPIMTPLGIDYNRGV